MGRYIGTEKRSREAELWRRLDEGDGRAREELVDLHMQLARRLARRYAGVLEPYDDLLQVACLGLLNAIDRFDPAAGTPFVGFAKPTILGELKRHLRDKVWTVRIPRPLHDRAGEIDRVLEKLAGELGHSPSVGEIAERLDIDQMEVLEALEADRSRRMVSLDAPTSETEGGAPRVELIGAEEPDFARIEDRAATAFALGTLDHGGRELLWLRFGEELSQRQIAERVGRSQMWVSRRLQTALEHLRDQIDGPEPVGTEGR